MSSKAESPWIQNVRQDSSATEETHDLAESSATVSAGGVATVPDSSATVDDVPEQREQTDESQETVSDVSSKGRGHALEVNSGVRTAEKAAVLQQSTTQSQGQQPFSKTNQPRGPSLGLTPISGSASFPSISPNGSAPRRSSTRGRRASANASGSRAQVTRRKRTAEGHPFEGKARRGRRSTAGTSTLQEASGRRNGKRMNDPAPPSIPHSLSNPAKLHLGKLGWACIPPFYDDMAGLGMVPSYEDVVLDESILKGPITTITLADLRAQEQQRQRKQGRAQNEPSGSTPARVAILHSVSVKSEPAPPSKPNGPSIPREALDIPLYPSHRVHASHSPAGFCKEEQLVQVSSEPSSRPEGPDNEITDDELTE